MLTIDACASVQQMANLPSIDDIIHGLQDRRKINATLVMKVYIDLCHDGLDAHTKIVNHLIPTLAEFKNVCTAEKIFKKLLHRDEYCWTSLMLAYIECGWSQKALSLRNEMEEDCVQPTKHTLCVLLKASAKLRCIKGGQQLHAAIVEEGLECDSFVGISLINMYAKCGLLEYAREVFDQLCTRDVVSWTALIAGYSEYGNVEEALSCLEQMEKDGLVPDADAFACGLKACGAIRCTDKGRLLHAGVMQEGVEGDSYVCSSLVYMYSECGSLLEAQEVFDDSPDRDAFTWNAIFSAYTVHGLADNVLESIDQVRLEGISLDANSYACILKACRNLKALGRGQEAHSEAIKEGQDNDYTILNSLMDMYLGCGRSEEAEELFQNLASHDVVLWNTLIEGYLENMQTDKVLKSLDQMLMEGVLPDAATLLCNLEACGLCGCARGAQVIHTLVTKLGMERDTELCYSLITIYGECELLLEAQDVLDRSPERQGTLWHALLAVFVKHDLAEDVFRCLEQMPSEGVSPTASLLVFGLKASGILHSINRGREIHDQVVKAGLDDELFVSNSMIGMYGKLGSLDDVKQVFEGLHARDVVTWTAFVAAYTDHGCGDEALDCLKKMQGCKVSPNDVTYIFAMKASSIVGAVGQGQEIHSQVIKKGLEKAPFVCSSMVDMYVECGLVAEAVAVLNEQPGEALSSWNTLIRGFADLGLGEDALRCLEQMQLKGIVMDTLTFVGALKACICLEDIEKGRELHFEIVKYGYDTDLLVGKTLLDLYAKQGEEEEMCKIFNTIPDRDVVSWSVLIAGYSKHGLSEEVLGCLKEMQMENIAPNTVTFMSCLQACRGLAFLECGQRLHAEIAVDGCEEDPSVNSCLVSMYCRYGLLAEALDVFDEQPIHDVVSWNTLMSGYAEQEADDEVLNCLHLMQMEHVIPDVVTYTLSLKACGSIGNLELGGELYTQLVLKGLEKVATLENMLIYAYVKWGLFIEAQAIFNALSVQDVAPWITLIAGCVENGLVDEATHCLERMTQHGVSYNAAAYVCSLRACGSAEALEKGKQYHTEIIRKGFEKDSFVCNALMDMYAKCGLLVEVEASFDRLPGRNIISWSTLIVSYAEHGFNEKVLECFESMQVDGIAPDTFTFVSFLKTCGSMRALERGQSMHGNACKLGFLGDPLVENALVGMYARCDALIETQEVFNKRRCQDTGSWNTLVMAYTDHGCSEEALKCLEQMQRQGSIPNLVSYQSIMKACGNIGALQLGQEILSQILKKGVLKMSSGHGNDPISDTGELMLANACVDMLGKCGKMIDAMQMFDAMGTRDQVAWNAVIWGYARQGQQQHVFALLDRMRKEGVEPDEVTALGVLNLCSHVGLLDRSQEYMHALSAEEWTGTLSLEHFNCLLDLFGRAGQLDEAFEMIERFSFSSDSVTWATVLGACRSCRNDFLTRQVLEDVPIPHEKDAGTLVLISNMYGS